MADGLQFRVLENNLERLLYKIPPGDTFCPLLTFSIVPWKYQSHYLLKNVNNLL